MMMTFWSVFARFHRPVAAVCAAAGCLLLAACETFSYSPGLGTFGGSGYGSQYLAPYGGVTVTPEYTMDNVSFWDGDGLPGEPRIHISLSEQRAYFYKGNHLAGVSLISTGREGFDTPTGRFKIIQKNANHRSNLYGDYVDANGNVVVKDVDVKKDPRPPGTRFLGAEMPYFMRIHGGVGMHAGFLPGYPASHGCIRMPMFMAKTFFENAPLGTPVIVTH